MNNFLFWSQIKNNKYAYVNKAWNIIYSEAKKVIFNHIPEIKEWFGGKILYDKKYKEIVIV